MAGRTHLQHALPVTFGLKVAAWLAPLLAMAERLDQLRPRVERLQFGGAAGTLASLGEQGLAVQRELAAELGLACPDIPWTRRATAWPRRCASRPADGARCPRSPPTWCC
jgi:3-carboxy-cis,cis-muconate cycloisomerase